MLLLILKVLTIEVEIDSFVYGNYIRFSHVVSNVTFVKMQQNKNKLCTKVNTTF